MDISQVPEMKCPKCNGNVFFVAYFIRRIPGIITKNGKDQMQMAPITMCLECREPIDHKLNTLIKKGETKDEPST